MVETIVTKNLNHNQLREIFCKIGEKMNLDVPHIVEEVNNVLKSEITYIPVRHHSPASAILVKKYIEEKKPKLVLLEGPSSADHLIPFIVEKDTVPPIAIISIFTDTKNEYKLNGILSPDVTIPAKFQVYYPFISYSPELVVLETCKKLKIPVHFIDMPLMGLIPYLMQEINIILNILDIQDSQINTSLFYDNLSKAFGFQSFNETWETIFEMGAEISSIDLIRENLLLFCSFVRNTLPNDIFNKDGTVQREQFMRERIEYYMKNLNIPPKDIVVITGGMHSIVLNSTPPCSPQNYTGPQFDSLMPYSYFRISQVASYSSGNQAPLYYNSIWERFMKNMPHPFDDTALDVITDIYKSAREKDYLISVTDTINTFQSAKMLAMLRRRCEIGLKDIIDSIYMSVVKGNPDIEGQFLEKMIWDRLIGFKIGRITKKLGKLPLQDDFYMRIQSFGIELLEDYQQKSLNLRNDADLRISEFFWRTIFLDIGFSTRLTGPDVIKGNTGIFTETWQLHWSPEIDTKLIELNVFGSTIEEASKNKLLEELKKNISEFEKITYLLYQAFGMGFSQELHKIYDICIDSLKKDNNLLSLINGFSNLLMVHQFLSMKSNPLTIDLMEKIIKRSYYAIIYLIPNIANPPQDLEEKIIESLRDFSNILVSFTQIIFDLNAFESSLTSCVNISDNFYIKGGMLGILYLLDKVRIDEIGLKIKQYLKSSNAIKSKMGDFINGLIHTCKSKIIFNDTLIEHLNTIVEEVDNEIFMSILPAFRKCFSELEEREYNIFVDKLGQILGLKKVIQIQLKDTLDKKELGFFEIIDNKVKKIFEEWFGTAE